MPKRYIPWFFRHQISCPDCGFIVDNERISKSGFNCPRCETHYPAEEFWELNQDKYSREADLSDEMELVPA